LQYHYYSTRISTGNKITNNPPVSLSSNQLLDASSYYQTGNDHTYTNKYHFLEIPVTAGFQLIKNKKMPVSWELGFSLAYLLSSNALYYDPYASVYFASNQEANKMQVNAVTAILFGFRLNKNEWQIGPQFQYGLTDMYSAQTNNPGHLIYGGIKINFIPGKK
jgi:Outer membrane protein beta-barrel domain